MWFHRALHRLSRRNKKPKFREINWVDDGEIRPVTRGKAKQFGRSEDTPPGPVLPRDAACRIKSNLSYSSQAPLTKSDGLPYFRYEKRVEGEGRRRYFTVRLKE
ncbi:hypothetical protein C8A05DRAFT_19645 [Staphylotrichum tortipilum]|uniref:Uncharacterized protein n=1 Tax=Staphylotrichum tortipilum TaxID=2831512 RepID=A0AAN6MAX7_9PEZI|nr:hypothetical protein C8A05DRAFT_19645 [Staphylotrichum longicolle]